MLTNTLSTTWIGRSRRKFRSSRGLNCVEEICSATMVSEKTSAITVIIVPETTVRIWRAASALPR